MGVANSMIVELLMVFMRALEPGTVKQCQVKACNEEQLPAVFVRLLVEFVGFQMHYTMAMG